MNVQPDVNAGSFQAVDPEVQARVFTTMGSLIAITAPIGLLIAGPLSDMIDIQVWFLASGLACLGVGIVLSFIPAVINIEEGSDASDKGASEVQEVSTEL